MLPDTAGSSEAVVRQGPAPSESAIHGAEDTQRLLHELLRCLAGSPVMSQIEEDYYGVRRPHGIRGRKYRVILPGVSGWSYDLADTQSRELVRLGEGVPRTRLWRHG